MPGPRREGALIGLALGGLGAAFGLVIAEWWLVAALPAGAAAGAVAAPWIRPASRIPIRAIVVSAVVADVVAAVLVIAVYDVAAAALGDTELAADLVPRIARDSLFAIAVAGPWGLVVTLPCAYLGARILRQRMSETPTSGAGRTP